MIETLVALILVIGVTIFIVYGTFTRLRHILTGPYPYKSFPKSLYANKWTRVAQLATASSLVLSLIMVGILLFVHPPAQCPNWHLPDKQSTPLWTQLAMCSPTFLFQALIHARWKFMIEEMVGQSGDYTVSIPAIYVAVWMVFVSAAASQIPLAELVGKCWLLPFLNGFTYG